MQKLKNFENKQICTVWNEEQERWYFCVSDVVAALTDSTDIKTISQENPSKGQL